VHSNLQSFIGLKQGQVLDWTTKCQKPFETFSGSAAGISDRLMTRCFGSDRVVALVRTIRRWMNHRSRERIQALRPALVYAVVE
jgi:hypothetical protein